MSDWVHFFIVIAVQFLFFIVLARRYKERDPVRIFLRSALLGLVFGVVFDLVFGQYLNLFGYSLGFGPFFLLVNGALSYGLMIATVWLCRRDTFFAFYKQTVYIGIVYESINYLSSVWSWSFMTNGVLQELVVLCAAYFGLASLMAVSIRLMTKTTFRYFELTT